MMIIITAMKKKKKTVYKNMPYRTFEIESPRVYN